MLTSSGKRNRIENMPRVKGGKRLSSLLRIARIELRVPESLKDWLMQKAQKEGKSLSLLITELLEKAREEEERQGSESHV